MKNIFARILDNCFLKSYICINLSEMENTIYCEQCLKTMGRMGDEYCDLVVTSPPYDNIRKYNGYDFDFKRIANELYRVTKHGGVIVWVVNDATINGSETGTSFKHALYFKEIGFNIHDTMIWVKPNPMPLSESQMRYTSAFEYMLIFSKGKPKTFNPIRINSMNAGKKSGRTGQRNKDGSENVRTVINEILDKKICDNTWTYASVCDRESSEHPASFPERLAADHIYTWSNECDLVYDPFMGSGTVAKQCILMNRRYIGSEISHEYCQLITKRIKPYLQQTTLF